MRRYLFAVAAAATAALLTALPAWAANNVLTTGSAGGNAVNVNDQLHSSLVSGTNATFTQVGGNTTVTCKASTFSVTALTNPAAPGTATGTLDTQTFSNCSINVFGASIQSVTVNNLSYNFSESDGAGFPVTISPGTHGPIQVTVVVSTFGQNANCVYRTHNGANLSGNASNNGNTVTFTNQQFDKFSGPNICVSSADFSDQYGPVVDTTQTGSPRVFTN